MKFPLALALLAAASPLGAERATDSMNSTIASVERDQRDNSLNQRGRAVGQQQQQGARFQMYDANGDGIITRAEWRGTERSFATHDWNNDGVLSGDEVRSGTWRPSPQYDDYSDNYVFNDWNDTRFRQIDRNGDGRIARGEWVYGVEEFARADRNRDGVLTTAEFQGSDFDDDRGDRFEDLDVNGNGVVERGEWHASAAAFNWLDRDNNGTVTRHEMGIAASETPDAFAGLDTNRDDRVSAEEWHWSRRSFNQRDSNGDGFLSRAELGARRTPGQGVFGRGNNAQQQQQQQGVNVPGVTNFTVQANEAWNDTGIDVQPGDRLTFRASGSIRLSASADDTAEPKGSRTGRTATYAPLKQPAGMLIGRIGQNGTAFGIGPQQDGMPVNSRGRLFLSVNDDAHEDNVGTYHVVITVVR
jgi:Ca2+-binding EF-hand superfamily protein